jgi:cell wall-associated NlpC family hydrolase
MSEMGTSLEEISAVNQLAAGIGSSPQFGPIQDITDRQDAVDPVALAEERQREARAEEIAQQNAEALADERRNAQSQSTITEGRVNFSEGEYNAALGGNSALINYAKKFIGTPYVWGGESALGVDCSGLTKLIMQKFGVNVPHFSAAQARGGAAVDERKLKVGDLLFWDNSSRNAGADHVAMYIGDGLMIEALQPGAPVRVTKVRRNGMWARRYLEGSSVHDRTQLTGGPTGYSAV